MGSKRSLEEGEGSSLPLPGKVVVNLEKAEALRARLQELYSGKEADFMWDTTKVWDLVRPTLDREKNAASGYRYIGREGSKALLAAIRSLHEDGSRALQVLGAKGTGKSTVVCTISGYLLGSGERNVVYLSATQFIMDPVSVLLRALLLACEVSDSLLKALDVDAVVDWVQGQPWGSLLFVVDDWDAFEKQPNGSALENVVGRACMTHLLVRVSSVNSRHRQIWCEDDKAGDGIATIFFDGPLTGSELETWLGQSGLTAQQLQHVDRLTGGTPRLLSFYEEVGGDEIKFIKKIRGLYTNKLLHRFIGKLKTREKLRAALDLVLTGNRGHELIADDTDCTCFYMEEDEFRFLSPYLRSQAENFIMEQHAVLKSSLQYDDILTWVQAVRTDCETTDGRNPARIGWNVEALVISVIRFHKTVFVRPFRHYRTYAHGAEETALRQLTREQLRAGVLLGPLAFNEKAVDLVYIILRDDGLHVFAMQITVAQWKAKAKKESHKVWEKEVLPKWIASQRLPSKSEFCYIMPENVTLTDVPASFKRLGDIHESLGVFDELLDVKEPSEVQKTELVQCSGVTRAGEACKNSAKGVAGQPYRCRYHVT